MNIIISNQSMVPIYEQLSGQIIKQILSGELKENEALPSVRSLSSELRISALTVKKSYDRLEEEGYVVTVHGKGTYVLGADNSIAMEARKRSVEDDLEKVIEKAKIVGMTSDELKELLNILLEE